jgi:hypothetical protein
VVDRRSAGSPWIVSTHSLARTSRDALENFTTEALAAAIQVDPRPLLRALPTAVASASPIEAAEVLHVRTQVQVDGGIVDLVVEVLVDGEIRSLWIEVKAHAGLSGAQLDTLLRGGGAMAHRAEACGDDAVQAAVDACGADAALERAARADI